MPAIYQVEIEKIVFGGNGMGHLPDGRAVFVPRVLPGERVELKIITSKAKYAVGEVNNILNPSPERIVALCPHFSTCGGCHFQHIPYASQLNYKMEIFKDQLTRIGKMNELPELTITPNSRSWNYRNHIQFHVDHEGRLGYKSFSGREIIPISECHLPLEIINNIWPQFQMEPGVDIHRLSIRQDSFDEIMILLEGNSEDPPEVSLDLPVSVCYLAPDGSTRTLAGDDALTFSIKDEHLRVSPESFFQVNTYQIEKMIDCVCQHLPSDKDLKILELFSGVGLFSIFLARYASQMIAIENSLSACYDFATNLDKFSHVSLYEANVEEALPAIEMQPDCIVFDPPRAGLEKGTRDALIKLNSPMMIYISCDPATLARDVREFGLNGYTLTQSHIFDLFPQTYHIESINLLEKRRA